ncbi:hypothetical protein ACED98_11465 [Streptococcus thoraltensis]
MQVVGISSAYDVYNFIKVGAYGTGWTSGITEASNLKHMFRDMVEAAVNASRV